MTRNLNFPILELEKRIISNKNRYKLKSEESEEIKKTLYNQNILITGACGSIGKLFSKKIYNFNFKKIYFLDKNENALADLNRELVLLDEKK